MSHDARTQDGWTRRCAAKEARRIAGVLSDESAPHAERKEAAEELLPYYHARLAKMEPLLKRFLCEPGH